LLLLLPILTAIWLLLLLAVWLLVIATAIWLLLLLVVAAPVRLLLMLLLVVATPISLLLLAIAAPISLRWASLRWAPPVSLLLLAIAAAAAAAAEPRPVVLTTQILNFHLGAIPCFGCATGNFHRANRRHGPLVSLARNLNVCACSCLDLIDGAATLPDDQTRFGIWNLHLDGRPARPSHASAAAAAAS